MLMSEFLIEINAASTVSALLYSGVFDLSHTYFLVAGLAGVNPAYATIGSATFARFEVQVALQREFDVRPSANYSMGYNSSMSYNSSASYNSSTGYTAGNPSQYSQDIYGTEVFELNEGLRFRVSPLPSFHISRAIPH